MITDWGNPKILVAEPVLVQPCSTQNPHKLLWDQNLPSRWRIDDLLLEKIMSL